MALVKALATLHDFFGPWGPCGKPPQIVVTSTSGRNDPNQTLQHFVPKVSRDPGFAAGCLSLAGAQSVLVCVCAQMCSTLWFCCGVTTGMPSLHEKQTKNKLHLRFDSSTIYIKEKTRVRNSCSGTTMHNMAKKQDTKSNPIPTTNNQGDVQNFGTRGAFGSCYVIYNNIHSRCISEMKI